MARRLTAVVIYVSRLWAWHSHGGKALLCAAVAVHSALWLRLWLRRVVVLRLTCLEGRRSTFA